MKKGTILSVDDDTNLQVVIAQYLEDDGYNVLTVSDGVSAIEALNSYPVDGILLDLILPDAEGMSLIPQIRQKTHAPVIVVSGKSDTTEKIICLEMGADDYMTKPFEMRELSARIKAVLRRSSHTQSGDNQAKDSLNMADEIDIGNGWIMKRNQYTLLNAAGEPVDLTTGEFQLLEALVLSANRALSREYLFDLTRDGKFDIYDRAIDIQIARLRKKLDTDPSQSSVYIKTIRGIGYMYVGQVATKQAS